MVGFGDKVGAGEMTEVDPGGLVVHVQDLGDLFGGNGCIPQSREKLPKGMRRERDASRITP